MVALVRAAKADVCAAARHLRGDGHPSHVAGLRDDACFFRVVFRIQHVNRNAAGLQCLRQSLRLRNVVGSHQHRLAGGVDARDLVDDRRVLLLHRGVDPVGLVEALQLVGAVDHGHVQAVEAAQLVGRLHCGAGHAAHQRVAAHERLQGDGVQDAPAFGHVQPLLGLHRSLQAVGPALQLRHAPAGGVHKRDLAVVDDVVHVPDQQRLRVQRQVHTNESGADVLVRVQRVDVQEPLDLRRPVVGEEGVSPVGVDGVVGVLVQLRHGLGDLAGGLLGAFGAGEHERHECFVHKHAVRLVDQRDVGRQLHGLLAGGDLVAAQVVEADLGHRRVNDVAAVGAHALLACRRLRDRRHRQPEKLDERAHPLRVARGQVVVHRDQMDALALQREPGGGHRADERFALAGGHLDHVALQQAQHGLVLHLKRRHAQGALGGDGQPGEKARLVGDGTVAHG